MLGISRLKHHLAKVKAGQVKACPLVPPSVHEGFFENFYLDQELQVYMLKMEQKDVPLLGEAAEPSGVPTDQAADQHVNSTDVRSRLKKDDFLNEN